MRRSKRLSIKQDDLIESTLTAIEKRLSDEQNPASLADLVTLLAKLSDMKLSAEWSRKLTRIILSKHPALLTSPLSKSGQLLEKVRTAASRGMKVLSGDGRESRTKLRRAQGDGVTLPFDEPPLEALS